MNKILGIALVVFAIVIAVVPFVTDCASQGKFTASGLPMRCYGNRIPELAIGISLLAVGMVTTFSKFKSKAGFFSLFGIAAVLGITGILMPNNIVGTCPNPAMICNTVMKPSLDLMGSLAIIASLAGIVLTWRMK